MLGLGLSLSLGASGVVAAPTVPWLPSDATSAVLKEWVDASDASTVRLNGTRVVSVANKTDGALREQAEAAKQPIYEPTGINGRPAVAGNGVAAFLRGSMALTGTAMTLLWLGDFRETVNNKRLVSMAAPGTNDWANNWVIAALIARNNNTREVGLSRMGSGDPVVAKLPAGPCIVSYTLSGASLIGRLNGVQVSTNAVVDSNFDITLIGYFTQLLGAATDFSKSAMGVSLIYQGALNADEMQRAEGMAAWRYGMASTLAANHPYRNAAPVKAA